MSIKKEIAENMRQKLSVNYVATDSCTGYILLPTLSTPFGTMMFVRPIYSRLSLLTLQNVLIKKLGTDYTMQCSLQNGQVTVSPLLRRIV